MFTGIQNIRTFLLALLPILLVGCGSGGGGTSQPSQAPPSASFSYPSGTQTFVVGTAITTISPAITGTLSTFTVSPALPAGLSLDASSGKISGTPKARYACSQLHGQRFRLWRHQYLGNPFHHRQ